MKILQQVEFNVRQRGAVLIVALIMLLILTVIAVSSMQGTSLQETMAGSARDKNLAFQASEAALREGERAAIGQFLTADINDLRDEPITGFYEGFPGVAQPPEYKVILVDVIDHTTKAGEPKVADGALTRIESTGFGKSIAADNTPVSQAKLVSTFIVEFKDGE
ncbi:hypothetical protein AX279_01700 [Pseudomonas sp. J237]|nr:MULTISPECIES: PilX N-terminal domain-containing pilus assembly protein [Pseudomonas]OEO27023.1 hypothetical protein AX279_01700 [Pseudomonas sp. J237]